MIARTDGRRSRTMTTRNFNGAVSGNSFSQESPHQDVYDFTFSSQGSTRWSSDPYGFSDSLDPYGLNNIVNTTSSSQQPLDIDDDDDDDELRILPVRANGEFDAGVSWKSSKKPKIGELDSDELTILSSKNARIDGDFGDELKILPAKKSKENGKFDGVCGKSKKVDENGVLQKKKNKKKKVKTREVGSGSGSDCVVVGPTATLMETQEVGEMMEHVDEVNFALDGLKKGQPVRVRRGSLLSLLSICGSAQQRRLLRAHGMAKTIIDAVLGLSFDDSPSNLAAAALFYVLTSDGQDDRLLDSPSCIRFLMKLLRPLTSDAPNVKASSFGSKLLAIRMDPDMSQNSANGSESSAAIMLKVREVLISCKDLKPRDANDGCMELPELNPKWISLLTMEKACFSTVSIEDTSGRVRRTGVNFKEKLRELGGLNAVFEVARHCHCVMEGWLERSPSSVLDLKDKEGLESLVMLLKCLKIMENATFLSKDNQSHLLGMKGSFDSQSAPRSFTKLILGVIKILSGITLLKSSLGSQEGKICNHSNETSHASDFKVDDNEILSISRSTRYYMEGTSSLKSLSLSQDSPSLTSGQPLSSKSNSGTTSMFGADPWLKMRIDSSTSGQCSGTSEDFTNGTAKSEGFRVNFVRGNNHKGSNTTKFEPVEDSQDPFAFDEDDFEPSKWDLLSGRKKVSRAHNSRAKPCQPENECQSLLLLGQEESRLENQHSSEVSCSSVITDEKSNLIADCLLSAVKVLMNLTNDNPMGCQQIAACGGLETLSSLIASHFPNFCTYVPPSGSPRENGVSSISSAEVDHQNDRHLTDEELDLLVAILGLLVNLVEKDGLNRSRLAAIRVSLPNLEGLEEESPTDLIPLLCSIFLANQGSSEAAGEGKQLSWDDEDALLQEEKEAEKMILEAYAALLLAFLSTESRSIRKAIAECLPDHNLAILVPVLERFVEFHLSLDMISPETHTTVLEVIESCRIP
ncbi:hypothetical protein ACH5RR_017868 [Cinchona calisaya]|uniref:Wings apart-like protein C-terminal domain-containing protein n=1 Tax=Cinchona calisaya TaxID=153742 RepID=A0ABD2ZJT6_9GENT